MSRLKFWEWLHLEMKADNEARLNQLDYEILNLKGEQTGYI